MTKFQIDLKKLEEELRKKTPVTQIVQNLGLPKEAKPYVYNAIKKLQKDNSIVITKVKPGVYELLDHSGSAG